MGSASEAATAGAPGLLRDVARMMGLLRWRRIARLVAFDAMPNGDQLLSCTRCEWIRWVLLEDEGMELAAAEWKAGYKASQHHRAHYGW